MYKALSAGAIKVSVKDIDDGLAKAKAFGWAGIEINPEEIASLIEAESVAAVNARFEDAGVRPAAFGLPTDWRGEREKWEQGVRTLPRLAAAAAAIGCRRTMTWVLSCSDERPHDENRAFHVERFTPIARILADHDIPLGLEFLGPKTLRESKKYPFISSMGAMLELGSDIGPNVGLLLDAWHWYTSNGTLDDLNTLKPEQVVYVHVNDAPKGVALEDQIDNVRCLPAATGVIPIKEFMGALQGIRYEGPITAEPFDKTLIDLPSDEERLKAVSAALDKIL